MVLTGKAKKDFNKWRFEIKGFKRDNYISEYNDIVILSLIEMWLNSMNTYLIPNPILGPKNGYDSFPIIGWRYDLLSTNKNTMNSFYMGYPVQDWFVYENLEKGEVFSDINIEVSENLKLAKEFIIKKFNESYNNNHKDTSVLEFVKNYTKKKWIEIETDIDFSKYEPISTDSSLHVFEEKYLINNKTYKLYYEIGGNSEPFLIEKLID